ncbi:MAG TPA: NAD(P)/FAD-dependent oxidoreductase [Candidatus Blautia gallistercoris]|uniref:NAD(P)/FAD-dependent oxidoreductase n=1 Tax=Candidatus Blautia gallistercoris TaxID=2838490 RepID=A0A9D1WGJ7_9FIRM|nr:NAD(P)/FAD-dependent oxidoreductase [Candidatus Blautia gallistercoris]
MEKKEVLVIGGGASGLMAAITAARMGARVTVLEHNPAVGKKILATGNGRCNLTNVEERRDAYRCSDPAFPGAVLRQAAVSDTIRFFMELGIYTRNRDGWLYPYSNQAGSVVDVLLMEAAYRKVKIKTNAHIQLLAREAGRWTAVTEGWSYKGDAVILACGSRASQVPGADGSGYTLANALGHSIVKPLPALVPLVCRGADFAKWAGIRTEGVVRLLIQGAPVKEERGELQLTNYGISGIPVFQLSRYAARALEEGCRVSLEIDFLPDFEKDQLKTFLQNRQERTPYKNQKELLIGLFPDKLIPELLKQPHIIRGIKQFPLEVVRPQSFAHAQVCSGGIDVSQVCPDTLESRLHKGLYFAGEILDVDGACGGYNLQWAWSSGMVAGRHAAGGGAL